MFESLAIVWRYALASALVLASMVLRAPFVCLSDTRSLLLLPLTAVCLGAWLVGAGPATLATVLAGAVLMLGVILSADFLLDMLAGPGMLLGVGVLVSLLLGKRRVLRRRLLEWQRQANASLGLLRGQLRESEDRFTTLADCLPVMLWLSDPDGQHTYFNRRWLEFTGRPVEQELGEGWADNVHPDDLDRYRSASRSALEVRRPFELEYRLRRHDGMFRDVLCRGEPRFSPDGTFLGYIGSGIDLAERHQVERELRHREESLQDTVRHSNQTLTALSHEWRSPLAALVNAAALLRMSGLSAEDESEGWAIIDRQVGRLSALADELLDALRRGTPLSSRPEPLRPSVTVRRRLPVQSRSMRLLVIEDNIDTATALAEFFRRLGHVVEVVYDGTKGYQTALKEKFDAVLCDLGLPGMTGYEVARSLRANDETASVPLLAISGYGEAEDRLRSLEAGFDLHLTKPVNPNDLLSVLSELLQRKRKP